MSPINGENRKPMVSSHIRGSCGTKNRSTHGITPPHPLSLTYPSLHTSFGECVCVCVCLRGLAAAIAYVGRRFVIKYKRRLPLVGNQITPILPLSLKILLQVFFPSFPFHPWVANKIREPDKKFKYAKEDFGEEIKATTSINYQHHYLLEQLPSTN